MDGDLCQLLGCFFFKFCAKSFWHRAPSNAGELIVQHLYLHLALARVETVSTFISKLQDGKVIFEELESPPLHGRALACPSFEKFFDDFLVFLGKAG